MSSSKTGDSDGRYGEVCGATNNRGEPCKLPAGWGTPGSQGGRCKYHGGSSTGPNDTDHLEENDFADGNVGGGAPELNTNAQTANGVWSDWRKVYARLGEEHRETIDRITQDRIEHAKPHTPDMDPDRRERFARELSVLSEIRGRIDYDIFAAMCDDPPEDARGVTIKEEIEIDGETYTVDKPNPTLTQLGTTRARRRKLREKLRLYPSERQK